MLPRTTSIVAGLSGLLLLGICGAGIWWGLSPWALDRWGHPAQQQVGEPDNENEFVGSDACRNCHTGIAEQYDTSGHAHTFHLTTESEVARRLAGVDFEDPVRRQTFRYHFDAEGLSASLPQVFGDEQFPLMYALGSGAHGVTFLSLLPHKDGGTVGLEHRATYYPELQGLGLTVGHPYLRDPVEDAEYFGKVLDGKQLAECLGCHTTRVQVENHQLVNLLPHVGCENCHGPGSAHVAAQEAGLADGDFRTAGRWPTALEELRTCGACHRLPESLKKSELVRSSRVLPRFQPAGLMQSRCFTESEGALRCTTCHDPHATVSHDRGHYERICLDCHRREAAAECPKGTERCIQCHMPEIAFEGVAAFHDHWIRVRNAEDPPPRELETAPER